MANLSWLGILLATTSILAQSTTHPLPISRDRAITFPAAKPVLGLPLDGSHRQGLCSSDGLSYFDSPTDTIGTSRVLDLYTVATSGEVRHLSRTAPIEFTNVINRDFFPGDAALVTLIEAQKRDTNDPDARPREIQYYVSVSDHDGDQSKQLALALHFKPLKIAQFGAGDFLLLGWDEANQLPQLAVLKEDGTLRRFIDFDERSTTSPTKVSTSANVTLTALNGAAFVPFGSRVLLTYPGTVKPMRLMAASGYSFAIALAYPPGYELHDVLNSGSGSTLVVRVQEIPSVQTGKSDDDVAPPRQRLFEFNAQTGARIREFTFDKVPVSAITCAANHSLDAIFEQPSGTPTGPDSDTQAMQLVAVSVLR